MRTELARSGIFAVLSLTLLGLFSAIASAQAESVKTPRGTTSKRVNLYGDILGSIELPGGFRGFMTADFMDAWAGHIESPDSGFKLNWRAGTIVYLLEDRKKDIEWQRDEKIGETIIRRASLQGKDGKTLVTKIGWIEFSSLIRNSEDEKFFTLLLDSYQTNGCKTCRSLPRNIRN
jgi:hypothetical protein